MSANQERREQIKRAALRHFLLDALLTLDGCAYVRGPVASKDAPPSPSLDFPDPICTVCGKGIPEGDADEYVNSIHHACAPEYWACKADDYSESAFDREREARGFEPDHHKEDEGHA